MDQRSRMALGAAAVLTLTATGVVGGAAVLHGLRQAKGCEDVEAHLREYGHVVASTDGKSGVAVLGDSYTAGLGLEDPTEGWAFQVGGAVAGVGGTGFVNGGPCGGQSFGERLDDVLATQPGTLVVQGGLNDTGQSPDTLRDAAAELLEAAADTPRVVVLGPVDAPATQDEAAVDAALSDAARDAGREYVSGLDWDLEFLPDRLHLTEDGHDALARHVTERIDRHRHGAPEGSGRNG